VRLSSGTLHQVVQYKLMITLMMEAESTCEMSVNFYQTTQRSISEDSSLATVRTWYVKNN
jgi:hypothetical protein